MRCLLGRAQGDPDAFVDFYALHADRVLAYFARRVLDAETAFDLTSETFAIALEKCPQFKGGTVEEEEAWLFAIARSQLTRFWRTRRVEHATLDRLGIPSVHLDDGEIQRIESEAVLGLVRRELQRVFADIAPAQQEAVVLKVVDELGYPEIAARAGVTEQVARSRVSRGLRAMRRELDAEALDGMT